MKLYGIAEAAAYCGLSVSAIKYHVRAGNIRPELVGHSLVFTKKELNRFMATKRPQGRPRRDY